MHCQTPTLESGTVRRMFLQAYRQLMEKRGQILEDCTLIRQSLTNLRDLDTAIATQVEEAEIVAELVRTAVKKNASSDESEGAFRKSYEELCMRYEKATQELNRLREERESRVRQAKAMEQFMREVRKNPAILDAWDDTIWTVMIKHAIVHRDGDTHREYDGGESLNFTPLGRFFTPHLPIIGRGLNGNIGKQALLWLIC